MKTNDYEQMVREIDDDGEDLTDWEIGFISYLFDKPPIQYSTDQRKKIIQIHARRIPT